MFPFFPYTNFHELNADWILKTVKQIGDSVSQFADNLAHVVRVTAQNFTVDEQRIACGNIKAVSYHTQSASAADRTTARANLQAVGYEAQTLTDTQQTAARDNISAASQTDMTAAQASIQRAVRWDAQTLTDAQKSQARANIGASQIGTIPAGVVRYDAAQTLTVAQKAQARENIGANSGSASDDYVFVVSEDEQGTGYDVTGNLSDAAQVTGRVFIVLEQSGRTREALAELTYTGGALSYVCAYFADFFAADSSIPNTITEVIINSNGATVTDIQQQQVPHPAPLGADAGKCLVAGNNTCTWMRITPIVNTLSGTTPTITPADNNIYNCGELTSLTVSNPPATGAYSIVFTSGATATVASGFSTIIGLESFTPEANTIYEINVLNNRAVVGSWAVSV